MLVRNMSILVTCVLTRGYLNAKDLPSIRLLHYYSLGRKPVYKTHWYFTSHVLHQITGLFA